MHDHTQLKSLSVFFYQYLLYLTLSGSALIVLCCCFDGQSILLALITNTVCNVFVALYGIEKFGIIELITNEKANIEESFQSSRNLDIEALLASAEIDHNTSKEYFIFVDVDKNDRQGALL